VDRLLDVGIYAPLGFLLTRQDAVADLAAVGRKQIEFSRSLGRAALKSIARGAQPPKPGTGSAASRTVEKQDSGDKMDAGAIAGFENLTAKEIIGLISSCSDAEAAWIRRSETASKNRVTVLRALDARG